MVTRPGILVAAALIAQAQSIVPADSARAPFDDPPPSAPLHCQFTTTPPALNYALRFQTALGVSLPLTELRGAGHQWSILLRVTPAKSAPVYLSLDDPKPETLENNTTAKFEASFALGEGSYEAAALLRDGGNTVCQHTWNIHPVADPAIRGLGSPVAPGQVASLDTPQPITTAPKLDRLTILLDAAAVTPGHAQLTQEEVQYLIGALGAVLERLSARSTRLVIFNLDRIAPLFTSDDFSATALPEAFKAIANAQFAAVDYRALRASAAMDRVVELLKSETSRSDPPNAVLFLGPEIQLPESASDTVPKSVSAGASQLFYLQFCQFRPREEAMTDVTLFRHDGHPALQPDIHPMPPMKRPDPIAHVLRALRADVISIYRPIDLPGALRRIGSRASATGAPAGR